MTQKIYISDERVQGHFIELTYLYKNILGLYYIFEIVAIVFLQRCYIAKVNKLLPEILLRKKSGPSFAKGRKFCHRRRHKPYIRIYVCIQSVLLKAVSSAVNVEVNVDIRTSYDWSFQQKLSKLAWLHKLHIQIDYFCFVDIF